MNCGIYLWTNVKNNKKYVGQSSNLHNRHLSFLNFDKPYAGGIINRARLKYNGSIYKCLFNERKSAGDFIWKYKEGVSQK